MSFKKIYGVMYEAVVSFFSSASCEEVASFQSVDDFGYIASVRVLELLIFFGVFPAEVKVFVLRLVFVE